jgi:hypothetical protein
VVGICRLVLYAGKLEYSVSYHIILKYIQYYYNYIVILNRMAKTRTARRNTRKQKTRKRKWYANANLLRLGSGSYGTIYILPDKTRVMKEHTITNHSEETCPSWEREYNTQTYLYNTCNEVLNSIGVSIAKPYAFHYAQYTNGKRHIRRTANGASSCFFTMERMPGRLGDYHVSDVERKLSHILRDDIHFFKGDWVPPYMFLSSMGDENGPIYLHMLKGVKQVNIYKDAIQYCNVEPGSIGFSILRSMVLSFFIILATRYIPRDIEFVFNGLADDSILVSILDFNEVRTIDDRAKSYGAGYDIHEDIAHVYIDLAGLRATTHTNPMAPYDLPTPQWKFLCSPLTAPTVFITFMQSIDTWMNELGYSTGIEYSSVFETILVYIRRNYFEGILRTIPSEFESLFRLRPVHIYTVSDMNADLPQNTLELGLWTPDEFANYYKNLAHFNKKIDWQLNGDEQQKYIVGLPGFRHELYDSIVPVILRADVVFDIEFQQYILLNLISVLIQRNIITPSSAQVFFDKQYNELIAHLTDIFNQSSVTYVDNNDWTSPLFSTQ